MFDGSEYKGLDVTYYDSPNEPNFILARIFPLPLNHNEECPIHKVILRFINRKEFKRTSDMIFINQANTVVKG